MPLYSTPVFHSRENEEILLLDLVENSLCNPYSPSRIMCWLVTSQFQVSLLNALLIWGCRKISISYLIIYPKYKLCVTKPGDLKLMLIVGRMLLPEGREYSNQEKKSLEWDHMRQCFYCSLFCAKNRIT